MLFKSLRALRGSLKFVAKGAQREPASQAGFPKPLLSLKETWGHLFDWTLAVRGLFAVTIADAQALPKDLSAVTANVDLANLLLLRRNFRKPNHQEKQTAHNSMHNYCVAYKPCD